MEAALGDGCNESLDASGQRLRDGELGLHLFGHFSGSVHSEAR